MKFVKPEKHTLRNFNYDPHAIYNDFKEQERLDGRIYVSGTPQDREFRSNIRIHATDEQSGGI